MRITLIAAMAENRVIGRNNLLPWRLPADLKHFKQLTLGKPVIMGRNTYESIGKPLPDRTNVIITHDKNYQADGCIVVHSIDDALQAAQGSEEVMVIGGARLYAQMLSQADRLYLTIVHAELEGDAFFPEIEFEVWDEIDRQRQPADDRNEFDYSFVILERRS